MKCPKDKTQLSINSKEGVVGYCCDECQGIFLKGNGTKAFKLNFDTEVLENSFENTAILESQLNCPCCQQNMYITHIDDIEIDICQHCQGVWFDKNEVSKIIDLDRKNPTFFESLGSDLIVSFPFPLDVLYAVVKLFKS